MKFIKHLNGKNWKKVIDAKWWPNQKEAVAVVAKYFEANTEQQAMIRMPTGTGKTVVIATLAQLCEDYPRVLVVAPSEYRGNSNAKSHPDLGKNRRKRLTHSSVDRDLTPKIFNSVFKTVKDTGVLICTDQTLQLLQKNASAYRRLKKWGTLTLVDEGHREPAPRWAEAVRELEKPTVFRRRRIVVISAFSKSLPIFSIPSRLVKHWLLILLEMSSLSTGLGRATAENRVSRICV